MIPTATHARSRVGQRRAPRHIPRVPALSVAAVRDDYLLPERPVVITNVASRWPAVAKWNPAYLRAHAPDATVDVTAKTDYGKHVVNEATPDAHEITLATLLLSEIVLATVLPVDWVERTPSTDPA